MPWRDTHPEPAAGPPFDKASEAADDDWGDVWRDLSRSQERRFAASVFARVATCDACRSPLAGPDDTHATAYRDRYATLCGACYRAAGNAVR